MTLLQVGDTVLIRDDIITMSDCRSGLTDDMREWAGKTATICKVYSDTRGDPIMSGECFMYLLAEDAEEWVWSDDCFDEDTFFAESNQAPDISELI